MPNEAVEGAPVVDWSGDAFRLIPSRFPPVNVYDGIVANDRLEEIYAAEELTNPRLKSLGRMAPGAKDGGAADPKLQNWNLAPFAYGNPDGSLFFDERKPCLEVSTDRQTALAVSVAKREAFLRSTQEGATGLDMRMLRHPVNGKFWDLRDKIAPVSEMDEKERWSIGKGIPDGADGVLYRSAERPAGTCIAILTGNVLGRSVQTVHFRYQWDGCRIAKLYVFNDEGTEISPDALIGAEDILTAA